MMTVLEETGPEPLSKKTIAELKMQHGDALVYTEVSEGTFVFRRPSPGEWKRYTQVLMNDRRVNERGAAQEQLCYDTLVYPVNGEEPDVARLRSVFRKLPGLPLSLVNDIGDLAGAGESVKVGKL